MIPVARPLITQREKDLVQDCLDSGWVSSKGQYIGRFEQAMAEACGAAHGVAVMNGTVALHLALAVLGVGPGDEVIVPALTFVATANAVTYTGATPVLVDSRPDDWNMDPALLEGLITPATKGVIAVHLYGHPADMNAINEVAARRGLWVVEDAAEAHGARVRQPDGQWKAVGGLSTMGCFSFYGNKIITTGEGGMVLTDDAELDRRLRLLRDHGMDPARPYWHPILGYNYRMTNLQAAMGAAQMERFDQVVAAKRRLGRLYAQGLADVPGLTLAPEMPWAQSVFWMYGVLVDEGFGLGRDQLAQALRDAGVDTRPFFIPLNLMPPYQGGPAMPVAEGLAARGLSLPSGPDISDGEVAEVCRQVRRLAR